MTRRYLQQQRRRAGRGVGHHHDGLCRDGCAGEGGGAACTLITRASTTVRAIRGVGRPHPYQRALIEACVSGAAADAAGGGWMGGVELSEENNGDDYEVCIARASCTPTRLVCLTRARR
jgi:hypothetical protein